MTWNHRLVDMSADNDGDPALAFREVFYDDDGKPMGHTEPFMWCDDIDGVRLLIQRLTKAIDQPILKPEDFLGEVK